MVEDRPGGGEEHETGTVKPPSRLVYFTYEKERGMLGEYLQITALSNIGKTDTPPTQKIIRLNDEDQRRLFQILQNKFQSNRKDELSNQTAFGKGLL